MLVEKIQVEGFVNAVVLGILLHNFIILHSDIDIAHTISHTIYILVKLCVLMI